jgi:hypothetical protein
MARRKSAPSPVDFNNLNVKSSRKKKSIGKEFLLDIQPITETQQKFYDCYDENKHLVAYGVPGSGKTFSSLYKSLQEVFDETSDKESIYIVRSLVQTRSIGFMPGPQPLDANILTPSGWTTMGEIKVGDYAIGRNGKPTKVIGLYPQGKKLVYKITTTENTYTECCEDHLWMTKTFEDKKRQRDGSVKSTKQIIDTLYNKNGKPNHYIPRNGPVHFNKNELAIPPYTMGVILGDGSISSHISIFNTDFELVEKVNAELNSIDCNLNKVNSTNSIQYLIRQNNIKSKKVAKSIVLNNVNENKTIEYETVGDAIKSLSLSQSTIYDRCKAHKSFGGFEYNFKENENKWTNPVKEILFKLGLEGTKSHTKFIPKIYKYSSIEDRIELLRGLMDTDGTIKDKQRSKSCYCSYTTTSKQLAEDVVELVQSLGGRSTYWVRDRRESTTKSYTSSLDGSIRTIKSRLISYDLSISLPKDINPFFISRKSSRFAPKYIRYVGIQNIEPMYEKEVQCILVEDPEHLYITDQYIVTHNTETEKQGYFETPYRAMVKHMFQLPNEVDFDMLYDNLKSQKTIKFYNTSFLRGLTFDDCVIIVDEFQNLNFHELSSIITRVGENCRIIFSGDAEQTDLISTNEKNGIHDFMRILQIMPSFDILEFGVNDICRSGLVKEFILAKRELGL